MGFLEVIGFRLSEKQWIASLSHQESRVLAVKNIIYNIGYSQISMQWKRLEKFLRGTDSLFRIWKAIGKAFRSQRGQMFSLGAIGRS